MVKEDFKIPVHLTQLISSVQAYQYGIVPVENSFDCFTFKSFNATIALRQELEIILGKAITLLPESEENIKKYLAYNYRKQKQLHSEKFEYSSDFLEKLLSTAKHIGSSDIHFEIYDESCRVRLRLDGKLKEYYIVEKDQYPTIINKLKIKAGLDISEKRLPQDGRITMKTTGEEFDIRVSTLPTLYGEKMVLRILAKDTANIHLDELGFTTNELKVYTETIKKPNGIILISGPTGSGKTTTLYATLKLLNDEKANILTIEDPIEYTLDGVNQVQLKANIGLDFSSTLRTFLRQDPDVIMVGEIRDAKTANMAIRAAMTGHLVLSTIHTNSAWATISRLIDMDIPPFLIASTLNMSVAQRLVRKLCPSCRTEKEVNILDFPSQFEIPKALKRHYVANGCDECFYTGYQGRKAIYEIIPITKKLITHIKNKRMEIDNYLGEEGIISLKENAVKLVLEGTTSVEEVYPLLIE